MDRYEFRVWSNDLAAGRLRALGEAGESRESAETYLVSMASAEVNPKARADLLDIKTLVGTEDGFEQWTVRLKAPFPVSADLVAGELFPLLGIEPPPLARDEYTLGQLVDEIVAVHPDLAAAEVVKRRQMFAVNGCTGEVSDVTIDGRPVQTVAIESSDLDALRRTRTALGLDEYENVSYPRAIRERLHGDGD